MVHFVCHGVFDVVSDGRVALADHGSASAQDSRMRLLRPCRQTSDPDRPRAWAEWPPAAPGRVRRAHASPEASTPLAKCLRRGREHTRLTGWEALSGSCDSHAGRRSAAKRTRGLAPG